MRRLLLAAAVAVHSFAAHAQAPGSPEALQAAQELAAILSGHTIRQLAQVMTAQIWPNIERAIGRDANPAISTELRAKFEESLERFTIDAMKEAPAVYARHFSAQELRELTAFYKTPTGARALQAMPQVMTEYLGAITPRIETLQKDLRSSVDSIMQKYGTPK